MQEIWKDIKGYEGLYQISNLGNVKSLERHTKTKNNITITIPNKVLKPLDNGSGYLTVHLRKNGKRNVHYIHRLVAETFIGEIKNQDINHKDFNTYNNKLSNLEICSRKENIQYSYKKERYKGYTYKGIRIQCVETKEIFDSISLANKKYNVTTIKDCINGRQKTSANLHWVKI